MNKLQMAHDFAMKNMGSHRKVSSLESLVSESWKYADAMKAEADKRKSSEFPNVLRGACGEIVAVKVDDMEWQPDWSQSPDGYDWFAVDKKGTAYFYTYKPETIESEEYWADFTGISSNGMALESDSSFGYTGDWRNSLRKRPE